MITYSNIQVSETGTSEPVSLGDIKDFIGGLEGVSDFDALLNSMNTAAREDIENELNVKLVNATVSTYVDASCKDQILYLPYALSLSGITTINKIVNGEAPEVMTADTDYYLNGSLSFVQKGRYKIEYTITVTSVPSSIQEAIKMLVGYRYKFRQDNGPDAEIPSGMPAHIERKISKYRVPWL